MNLSCRLKWQLLAGISSLALTMLGRPAQAATFFVADENQLANAISIANGVGGADTIVFTQNITLSGALPVLGDDSSDSIAIDLAGFTVSGNNVMRVFFANAGSVSVTNGSIVGGLAKGGNGGNGDGADSGAGGGGMGAGGALYVRSGTSVTVDLVSFAGNRAVGGDGGQPAAIGDSNAGGGGGMGGNGGSPTNVNYGGGGGGGGALPGDDGGTATAGAGGNGGGPNGSAGGTGGVPPAPGGDLSGGGGSSSGQAGGKGGYGGGGGGNYDITAAGGDGGFGGGGGGGGSEGGDGGFGGGGGSSRPGTSVGNGGFGGGDGDNQRFGGGGAGFGGAVFVESGGTLVITGSGTMGNGSVAGGGGGNSGLAAGTGIYLQNASVEFAPSAGQAQIINDTIADDTGNGDGNSDGVAGDPSSGGSVLKSGAGSLTLAAVNSYTGQTEVTGGLLAVNGDITASSQVIVGASGTLGGSGRVPSVQVSGKLAPGNSNGTLTVADNLTFAAGSTYEVEISPASSDRVDVIAGSNGPGNAVLSGGTVVPIFESGSYIAKSYIILTAAGGLGGTEFAGLAGSAPAGFKQRLAYDAGTVQLVLDLEMREVPTAPTPDQPAPESTPPAPAPTPNQYSDLSRNQDGVRDAIVGSFDSNGGIPSEFAALTSKGLTQASGETAAAGIAAGQQAAGQFMSALGTPQFGDTGPSAPTAAPPLGYAPEDTVTTRVERAFGADFLTTTQPVAPASYWQSWGSAWGAGARSSSDSAIGSTDVTSHGWGLAAGHDIAFGGTSLGLALGGGWGSYELENGFGSGNVGSFHAGVRGTQEFGAAYLSGALAYGYHAFSTSRSVTGERYEADYSGHSLSGRAEAGWRIAMPVATFTPYGAVETVALFTPSYGETGSGAGLFALNYQAQDTVSTRLELGARLSHTIDLTSGNRLTLSGRAGYQHNLNPDRDVTAGFAGLAGTSFVTEAAASSRNSLLLTAGADYVLGGNVTLGLTADAAIGDNSSAFGGSASFKIRW